MERILVIALPKKNAQHDPFLNFIDSLQVREVESRKGTMGSGLTIVGSSQP
jgi:hypothetical protein